MALTLCKECGNEISSKATSCPKCGAKIKHTSLLTKIVLIFIMIGLIPLIVSAFSDHPTTPDTPSATNQALNDRVSNIVSVERQIKELLRNPDSAKWNKVLSNNDGSILCLDVSAQNGFGGMSREIYIVHGQTIEKASDKTIKKYCVSAQMRDVTEDVFN